jgi:hypothetical protein
LQRWKWRPLNDKSPIARNDLIVCERCADAVR